jgi:chromosome segregation ATPase
MSSRTVGVWMSQEERSELKRRADEAGLNLSAYVRQRLALKPGETDLSERIATLEQKVADAQTQAAHLRSRLDEIGGGRTW